MTSIRRPTVALLDYGMGNLHSVGKALEAYRRPSARTVALDQADALLAREKSAKFRSTAEPASFSADELMDRLFDGLGELFRLLR